LADATQDTERRTIAVDRTFTNVSKSFRRRPGAARCRFHAEPGEIHGLVGENGAGKSTMMKIIAGVYHASFEGEMRVEGKPGAASARPAMRWPPASAWCTRNSPSFPT
jgi:ABC-type sugar transport system ATPase subunit